MKNCLLALFLIFSFQVRCEFNLMDFSDDHKLVIFCHDNDSVLHYYDRDNNVTKGLFPNTGIITKINVTSGNMLISLGASGKLFIYDASQEKTIALISGVTDFITSGEKLIYGTRIGEVIFFDLKNFKISGCFRTHSGRISALCMKKDRSGLAIAGEDGHIRLLDLKKNSISVQNVFEPGNIQGIAFNESGSKLFISLPNVMCVWNSDFRFSALYESMETGKLVNFEKETFITDVQNTFGISKYYIRPQNETMENLTGELIVPRSGQILFIYQYGEKNNSITAYIYDRTLNSALGIYDLAAIDKIKGKIDSFSVLNDSNVVRISGIEKMTVTETAAVVDLTGNEADVISDRLKGTKESNTIEILNQVGYAGPLHDLNLSADGKYIVTTAESPIIKIWDRGSNVLVKEINVGKFNVLKAAVHPRLPLLVVMDQNMVLHVFELNTFFEVSSLKYTDRGYFEMDEGELTNISYSFNLFFNKSGTTLNLLSSGNNDEYGYTFRIPLTDLMKGKWKPITDKKQKNLLVTVPLEPVYPLLYSRPDSIEIVSKTYRTRLDSVSPDSTRLAFRSYNKPDLVGVNDLYEDRNLTIRIDFFGDTTKDVFFYKNKVAQTEYGYLVSVSRNEKYQVIKNNSSIYLFNAGENKVVSKSVSENHYFTPDSKFFVDDSVLVDLETGNRINFLSLVQEKKEEYSYYATTPKSVFYYDRENKLVIIWRRTFDHQYLEYDTKRKSLRFVKFMRPLVGQVIQSANTPLAYVNYRNYFNHINFLSLSSNDYVISEGLQVLKRSTTTQFKSDCTLNFDVENYALTGFSYVPINLQKPGERYQDKHWIDLSNLTLVESEFSIYDTLVKDNFFRARLTSSQYDSWQKQQAKFESFLNNSVFIRADTRTPYEYQYLNEVGLSANNLRYSEEDHDTVYHAFTDQYFGIQLASAVTGKNIKKFNPPAVGHFLLRFLYGEDKFVTYGFDGMSRVWDCKGEIKNPVVTYLRDSSNHMFITHDNYYKTTSRAFNLIKFRHNNKVYGIEQFDIKYNRPDIVLQRMGSKDTLMIRAYHNAYLKRLKKMGYTEEMLKNDADLPEIKIKNFESLPDYTDSSFVLFDLELKDNKYRLDRINVWVNDVPVYGTAGIDLRTLSTQTLTKTISIELAEGKNKIQVSVLNQAGVESYKEEVYVTRAAGGKLPNLFLVSIGDSKYKDSRFDLTYASKDAQDFQNAFSGKQLFANVQRFVLTNEEVTVENVRKIKTELFKAGRNDVVIIFVAGHGVLDNNFNYYLATYDMDFTNPAGRGLAYEELESLLDGIPPLKKLILMDACHSGEVDKDEVQLLATSAPPEGEIKFRSAGAGIGKKNLGLKSASGLMQELFSDFRRGTGATVISSAGGAEYAMESDQWKNGLFTYCLLHGLSDMAADANKDGQIMLGELQQYLRLEVTELSKGAQQPTSRMENLSVDFRIW